MARNCSVCEHSEKKKIDRLLVEGVTYREITGKFRLSSSALERHKSKHIPRDLIKAKETQEEEYADNLFGQVKGLQEKAEDILAKAEAQNDLKTALMAIREARGCCELLGKLLGELNESPQINILLSPEWVELRTLIIQSLDQYPKARNSITKALEKFTNGKISN